MPSYKLTYFKGKGIAEPIRYLLAFGNHEYEDIRLEFNETWPAKSSGKILNSEITESCFLKFCCASAIPIYIIFFFI